MLIKNIGELVGVEVSARLMAAGKEMSELGRIRNAWVLIEGERIADFGSGEAPAGDAIDAAGCFVFPSFCDSHTTWYMPAAGRSSMWIR